MNRHHRLVYAITLRILANQAEAEDATQEVYERAWKHIDKIDEADAKAWLGKVARNLAIDRLRARKPIDSLDTNDDMIDASRSTEAAMEHHQLSQWLKLAIGKLKEPYKSLVMILDLQQKSVREAAAATHLSENQVKVYAHRARKQLRTLLQGGEL